MNLSALAAAFNENLRGGVEIGASAAVWHDGNLVLELAGGFRDRSLSQSWTASTPVLVWSATKGPAAACVLYCLQESHLSLDTPVSRIWPEFAAAGKELITCAQLLSHQAGLPALEKPVSILDYDAVIAALAAQRPLWPVGKGHGYHPRTFGFLLDEIVRRLTGGITLGAFWRQTFADPLGLDLWIGMPPDRVDEVAPIFPPRASAIRADPEFYVAFTDPATLTHRSFASPGGLSSVASMNTPEARAASFAGFGGIGTATALARFYAIAANGGALDGKQFFKPETLTWMTSPLASGTDNILQIPTAFSAGYMKDPLDAQGVKLRRHFGPSLQAFGQPGAGGSIAFADPENRIAFAYVMNQMGAGPMPNERALSLIEHLYAEEQ